MSTRVSERVDEWPGRPFAGGYGELHDLADADFSGVVRAGPAELYMTKGTAVGVRTGSIEDFEDGEGTVYEAPTPALPLLAVMQDRDPEVRAEYYTEDTSVVDVDGKLSEGGFTGYIELSENVLSGDYYVVYHRGRSMSVAFVGNAERLLEGDDAFERADSEVGIYRVHPVEVDAIEIPAPTTPEPDEPAETTGTAGTRESDETGDTAGTVASNGPAETTETAETDGPVEASGTAAADEADPESASGTDQEDRWTTDTAAASSAAESVTTSQRQSDTAAGETSVDADGTVESETADRQRPSSTPHEAGNGRPVQERSETRADSAETSGPEPPEQSSAPEPSGDLETRSIPSLDPVRTESDDHEPADPSQGAQEQSGARGQSESTQRDTEPRAGTSGGDADRREGTAEESSGPREGGAETEAANEAEAVDAEAERLAAELGDREAEIERLEEQLGAAEEEKTHLESELASVRGERDELAAEVERLEGNLQRLEDDFGAATDGEQRLSPQEALDGTDIFVRYRSKGDATLGKAHGGSIRREDVVDNIILEKHTQFDADSVTVGGETYEEFIRGTVAYQFVEWVATELLFEIRDTGNTDTLQTLYDALPNIDRAELDGTVDVVYTEDRQETRSSESFDVVYRNRMGDPLLVADVNDSREAATQSMMESLVTAAERAGQSNDDFAGAFLVTTSFFEPGALETASEATRSGLLSRNKRKSFVNLSRKRGYHLCLVEARSENYNLTVPEL